MNPIDKKTYKLGPAIRNICDELINDLNEGVRDMANNKGEKTEKIREFKDKIKTNFHPLLKQVIKTLKSFIKLDEGKATKFCLNEFYQIVDRIKDNLTFLNVMTDVYIFPEFNINDTIDLIFEGCSNDLRQKLIDFQLFDTIQSKNLYNNNDIRFLINNDFNNIDYNQEEQGKNNINVLLDKKNPITKNIIKRLSNKLKEFNDFIISTKDGFNENNFKLYLDEYICLKLYKNFEIKFTIAQFNAKSYYILPVEIQYNKQTININDEDETFVDKNKLLTKNDLYFFINKFRIRKDNINDLIILSLNKTDFLEKCLLFKEYTNELFNEKFENIKREIKEMIANYDFPIKLEEKKDSQMEIENKNDIKKEENDINEIDIYFNFSITMKKKNEFYIKLIYNKEYPTNIKIIYSHFLLKNNIPNIPKCGLHLIIEEKEILFNLDPKIIKKEIFNNYEIYKIILMNMIGKKIKYIYPIYFNTMFIKENPKQIIFGLKNKENFIKYFSMFINDKGKLWFENLYSSKLFPDDFKEVNEIITNYLKCDEDDEKFNDYIIQFNDYIKNIMIEKILTFSEDKIKLIELDNNTKKMILHIYNSYCADKNISTYFEINCQLFNGNNNIIKYFKIDEIKLISIYNKDENKKIIFYCDCQNYQQNLDINSEFQIFFRKLANELNMKYELYLTYIYDIIKLAEDKITCFELNHPLIIKENGTNSSKEEKQWFEFFNETNNVDIFKKEYKDKFLNYFKIIKLSRENNIFKFILKDKVFKRKPNYSKIPNLFFENYTTMLQSIILGYELNEDVISITILGKMKLGYSNKIQMVFKEILPKLIYYMNSMFKLIDYLLINEPTPVMRICPIFINLQIKYGNNFKQHLNYKFNLEKEPYFFVDGNFNSMFNKLFVNTFGEEIILKQYDYNNKAYLEKKSKNFFINYQIFELLINIYKFKVSMIEYPFNHFIPENSNIYCIFKDFNVINLMSLNNMILTIQVRNDNNIYLEFRDKINIEVENNKYSLFVQNLKNNNDYRMNVEQNIGYNKVTILIEDESIDIKFKKFDEIIKIFILLSKTN